MSRFHVTGATGESPYCYIQRERLRAAQSRVAACETALAGIALDRGYASQGHMTSNVSARLGVSPGEVRAQARGRATQRTRRPV